MYVACNITRPPADASMHTPASQRPVGPAHVVLADQPTRPGAQAQRLTGLALAHGQRLTRQLSTPLLHERLLRDAHNNETPSARRKP
jgi:hypothetical protein